MGAGEDGQGGKKYPPALPLREHAEDGSAAAEQLGAEMSRRGSRHAGLLGVDEDEVV